MKNIILLFSSAAIIAQSTMAMEEPTYDDEFIAQQASIYFEIQDKREQEDILKQIQRDRETVQQNEIFARQLELEINRQPDGFASHDWNNLDELRYMEELQRQLGEFNIDHNQHPPVEEKKDSESADVNENIVNLGAKAIMKDMGGKDLDNKVVRESAKQLMIVELSIQHNINITISQAEAVLKQLML